MQDCISSKIKWSNVKRHLLESPADLTRAEEGRKANGLSIRQCLCCVERSSNRLYHKHLNVNSDMLYYTSLFYKIQMQ